MAEPVGKSPSSYAREQEEQITERRTLRDYYVMIRERFWIALPLALLVSIGLGYKQARETPMYQAFATMQFEKPERVVTTIGVADSSITSEVDLNTRVQVLNSAALRNKVAASFTPDEVKILQRPYLKNLPPGAVPPTASSSLGNVYVEKIPVSFLIKINVNHEDPEAAALVANRYVDQFMQRLREELSGTNEDAVEFLKKRTVELQKEAQQKEQTLQRYMKEQNLVSLDSSANIIDSRLKEVDSRLTSAKLQRLELESQVTQIENFQVSGRNLLEITVIANHASVPTLKAQLDELTRSELVLGQRYLEQHPKMKALASQKTILQQQLDQAIALAIADLRSNLSKARETENTLLRQNEDNMRESLRLREVAIPFRSLQQEAESAKKSYMEVADRLAQTTTTRNIEKIPLHTLDRAYPPSSPYTPDIRRIVKTCAGLGVFIFLGVSIGLSFIDDRIKSVWDVEHFIGVNLLGIIPDLSALKDEEKYSLVLKNREAPGLESFLSVYSAVKIHSKLDFPKSILITSTVPGEGKTLVSCNLAGSFARHGKRTLLVDCDLRRPMLHRHFNQENTAGLIPWYANGATLEGNLSENPDLGIVEIGQNLYLLCSGGRSKAPTELLESAAFGELIDRMKRHFELIIVDSPPLGAVTDSLLVAERTDEVIYVCRFNKALRKHIRLYINKLRGGKNEILGIVLNGLSTRRIEYYSNYRYYRSYKKYYGAET